MHSDVLRVVEFLNKKGYKKKGNYWLAVKLGVPIEVVKEARKLITPTVTTSVSVSAPSSPDTHAQTSRSYSVSTGVLSSTIELDFEPKDDEEIARLHKVDLTKFEIKTYYSKRSFSGKFAHTVLSQRRKIDEVTTKAIIGDFAYVAPKLTKDDIIINDTYDEGKLCLFNVTDFHLDKLDVKGISVQERVQQLYDVIDNLLYKSYRHTKIEELVYVVGSDFFNTDNYQGGTTKGTPQDNSMPWDEAFKLGLEININILTKLRQFTERLNVVLVCGNHDYQKSFYMAQALQMYFRLDENVIFDISSDYRKVVTYKKVFIGLNHGDCKVTDLPLVFAKEFPKEWGNATCHVICTGDKHHYSVLEIQGVRIKKFPALTGTDRWHNRGNFINSIRSVVVNIFDEDSQEAEFEKAIK